MHNMFNVVNPIKESDFYEYKEFGGIYFYILTQVDKFTLEQVYSEVTEFITLFNHILINKTTGFFKLAYAIAYA